MSENDDSKTQTFDGDDRKNSAVPKIERLGAFKIEKTLSSGGGGTVYLAFDESMKRRVALKVLHLSLSIAPKAQERFAREAWIAGQLEHQNIIKVYSRGEENQLNYIALEFAEGGSLSDFIKQLREESAKLKDLSVTANREHIKSIAVKFIELAYALEYIHSKGFIHRDIKPHNILLAGTDKKFKLTDFGIAHAEDMTRVTKAGDFFGTIHYMSPEQITAHRTTVDKRTDIYSLGVTLYEALTLSLPFEGDSEGKIIGEIIAGHYIPARKRLRSIPKDLETILMKATHHDASRRYRSARDFADDLQRFLELKPILARPDSIFYRAGKALNLKRRPNQVALGVILLLAVAGIVVSKVQQDRYDNEKILTSLKRAVETKTSPFDFEPEWPRLQYKLYDHVKRANLDSTMIYFFRTATVTNYIHEKYRLLRETHLFVSTKPIQIFDSDLVAFDTCVNSVAYLESARNIGTEDTEYLFYNYNKRFTEKYLTNKYARSFDFSKDQVPGEVPFPIKVYSKFYPLNSIFFNNNHSFIRNSGRRDKVLVIGGDSLMLLPSQDADPYATSLKDILVLDKSTMEPISPLFVDSILDTVRIFCFAEWPDDFPKSVFHKSSVEDMKKRVSFSDMMLIKLQLNEKIFYSKTFYATVFLPTLKFSPLSVPIGSKFYVRNNQNGVVFLKGEFWATADGYSHVSYFDGESFNRNYKFRPEAYALNDTINTLGVPFEEIIKYGKIDASLFFVPSINVARQSGELMEYFGDTLKFNISFQAFDSTKTN